MNNKGYQRKEKHIFIYQEMHMPTILKTLICTAATLSIVSNGLASYKAFANSLNEMSSGYQYNAIQSIELGQIEANENLEQSARRTDQEASNKEDNAEENFESEADLRFDQQFELSEPQTLIDYFTEHKQLPEISKTHPYNEIDALAFATLAYLPMAAVPTYSFGEITLKAFAEKTMAILNGEVKSDNELEAHAVKRYMSMKNLKDQKKIILMNLLASNKRYMNIRIGDLLSKYEKNVAGERVYQFLAVTFTLPDKTKVITYRGTDDTLSGWKEDIDLAWSSFIGAQEFALGYLDGILNLYKDSEVSVIGHSKGGHMAVYSTVMEEQKLLNLGDSINNRLIYVYNFDGPGLRKDILQNNKQAFDSIKNKLITYIPQTSIVGIIISNRNENRDGYKMVHSRNDLFKQHDVFSWDINSNAMKKNVQDNFFVPYGSQQDFISEFIEKMMDTALDVLDRDDIEVFAHALFKVIGYEDDDAVVLNDTVKKNLSNGKLLINVLKLNHKEQKVFLKVSYKAIKAAESTFKSTSPIQNMISTIEFLDEIINKFNR